MTFQIEGNNTGEIILFLNPMGSDITIWNYYVGLLEKDYLIVRANYPGYQDCPFNSYNNFDELLKIFESTFPEELKSKPIHLVGFSFGSWLAQHLMNTSVFHFASLTLIGTSDKIYKHGINMIKSWMDIYNKTNDIDFLITQFGLWSFYTNTFEQIEDLTKKYVDGVKKSITDPNALLCQINTALNFTAPIIRKNNELEVLILRGEYDAFYPKFCSEKLMENFKLVTYKEVPKSAHSTVSENPYFVGKELMKFLQKTNEKFTNRN